MKIPRIRLFLVILAVSLSGMSPAPVAAQAAKEAVSPLPEREELVYRAKWLGVPVGTATARINGIKKINGRDAYELVITVKTNDFCSRIYKIDDRYVSYMDTKELFPLRHEVYRREGRYKKDAVTDFDQANHKAYFRNLLDGSQKVIDLPPRAQDPVSMAYYFRLVPVKLGDLKEFSVYNNEFIYQMYGLIEKRLSIRVPRLGRKEAFLIQPYARLKGEMVKKGRARGYFDCGPERVPLVGVVKGPVFTEVVAYLAKE